MRQDELHAGSVNKLAIEVEASKYSLFFDALSSSGGEYLSVVFSPLNRHCFARVVAV
jgi:hypothetical protein